MSKFKPHKIDPNAHPVVREMFRLANAAEMERVVLARRAGVHRSNLQSWADGARPRVDMIDACLEVLGYELGVKRR